MKICGRAVKKEEGEGKAAIGSWWDSPAWGQ
jgi:hypothetical protein